MGGRRLALERGGVLEPGVLRPTTTKLRLEDMARDGVDATVMYGPIVPLLIKEPELRRVCYRAYNEWLAEFCATAPDRLVGAGLIPIDDPKPAADEVRYLKQLGLRTGMFLAARAELPLWDDAWEPLWEAAAETGLPIGFHLGGGLRTVAYSGPKAADAGNMGVRVSCSTLQMDEALAALIFSGALERYPGLRIVLAETGIGWLPYMLERMDDTYQKFLDADTYWRAHGGLRLTMAPSAYFRRQVWATFQTDHIGLRLIDTLGEDRVMWASDYPHADSTWPESQQAIAASFKDVAPGARHRILCQNAKALYGL
jgi:predicted TIM-barrel fold metal-dependent hydrolase